MEGTALLEALVKELGPRLNQWNARQFGIGEKHDASGTPISVGYTHGPGGVLSFPGVDPDAFHTIVGRRTMLGQLPTNPSLYTNPTYYTITGVLGDTGSEKTDVCDNAPTAGLMKACLTTSVFGRYERATGELELNRLGQRTDRADPMDLRLIGSPLVQTGLFGAGPENPDTPADLFTNEVARKFWERNVSFHRLLSRQLWLGNPDNNTGGGGYKEMTGFEILINTGYVDAETGSTCPSVDSYVRDANYLRIDLAGNGTTLVAEITNAYYQVKDRAERMGFMPVRWVIAMRPQLFYEITALWPCSYLSYRCNLGTSATEFIDAQDAVRFRDEMRAGRYLLIDGERIEVVVDDGIRETTNTNDANVTSGCFASDIYFIPMSVVGGRAVTFLDYFQYANPSVQEALGNMVLGRIEGAFLTWPRQTNQCVVWQSKVEPRLVLRTPWLAARLQHVQYCPIQHVRDEFPSDPYHVDGGRTSRSGPSFYSIWQSN